MPAGMQRTYIDTTDRFTLYYRELNRELERAGVTIVESPGEATAIFSVYADETGQRVLSVSARNVPTEFEVFYRVRYGVVSGTTVLVETQDISRTQDYIYDTTVVLGKAAEEEKLRAALVDDLVRFITRQLSVQ